MKQLYEMTLKQYYTHRINSMYAEYKGDITRKEIIESYPKPENFYSEYFNIIIKAAEQGIKILDIVLDKDINIRYRLTHDFWNYYKNYLPPEVRQQKKEIYKRKYNKKAI